MVRMPEAEVHLVAANGRVVGLNVLGWVAIFAPLGLLLLTSFRGAQMSVGAIQAACLGSSTSP